MSATMAVMNNIGRFAVVEVPGVPGRLVASVVDLKHLTEEPKRVRIQWGAPELKGEVKMPGEYTFCWWADEEED